MFKYKRKLIFQNYKKYSFVNFIFLFPVALWPNAGRGLLILEVS